MVTRKLRTWEYVTKPKKPLTFRDALAAEWKQTRFRSRLECRWAMFFDSLNLPWSYEPAQFALATAPYTPDFFVEGLGFFEIKPASVLDDRWQEFAATVAPLNVITGTVPVMLHKTNPNDHFEISTLPQPFRGLIKRDGLFGACQHCRRVFVTYWIENESFTNSPCMCPPGNGADFMDARIIAAYRRAAALHIPE